MTDTQLQLEQILDHETFKRLFPHDVRGILKSSRTPSQKIRLTSDSRTVDENSIFFALSGSASDGHDFIDEVARKNPILIIHQRPLIHSLTIPTLRVPSAREAYAVFCAAAFDFPAHSMRIIGITGTSGKTTTTFMIREILESSGMKTGLFGTVMIRYGDRIIEATHTTPDPLSLQSTLSEMKNAGIQAVIMEVSSHALEQGRVFGIPFDVMGFTNLSPEHLDYHKSMDDYFNAKKALFVQYARSSKAEGKNPVLIINESPWGNRLRKEVTESFSGSPPAIRIFSKQGLISDATGIHGMRSGVAVSCPFIGEFNAENLSAAIEVALAIGIQPADVSNAIHKISSVPGRLEPVPNHRGLKILVDYAHKPDALEQVLKTLRNTPGFKKIITVFGCGGDRDKTKRPIMGRIAEKYSDLVILTSDNPRTEDPILILNEIRSGLAHPTAAIVIADRKNAIQESLRQAQAGDCILIAGKGHETYQLIGKNKIPFDDRAVTLHLLDERP